MSVPQTIDRADVLKMVTDGLHDLLEQSGSVPGEPVAEETFLIGSRAVLDSIGLVTLIVDLEQRVDETYGVMLTLASERAMSQRQSPFRTVASLTDYICMLIAEEQANG